MLLATRTAGFSAATILGQAVRQPWIDLPELIRLRTRIASGRESIGRISCRLPILRRSCGRYRQRPCTPPCTAASRTVSVETVPILLQIGPGEILVRVEACGICHTDLKKIEYDLLPPPRIYGHETAGVVVGSGDGVTRFQPGDRVVAFHHIPCRIASTASESYTRSVRSTRKSASRPDSSRPAAASRSTCA